MGTKRIIPEPCNGNQPCGLDIVPILKHPNIQLIMHTPIHFRSLTNFVLCLLLATMASGCFLAGQLAPADPPASDKTENSQTISGPESGKPTSPTIETKPDAGTDLEPIPAPIPEFEDGLRRSIVDYSRGFIGIPYTAAGKQPSTGFDCSGFTNYVMSTYGVALAASARQQARQGTEVPLSQARPGDLIFYQRKPEDGIFHVSLVVENTGSRLFVIHSTSSKGIIVEDVLASSYWSGYIHSVRNVITRN